MNHNSQTKKRSAVIVDSSMKAN